MIHLPDIDFLLSYDHAPAIERALELVENVLLSGADLTAEEINYLEELKARLESRLEFLS